MSTTTTQAFNARRPSASSAPRQRMADEAGQLQQPSDQTPSSPAAAASPLLADEKTYLIRSDEIRGEEEPSVKEEDMPLPSPTTTSTRRGSGRHLGTAGGRARGLPRTPHEAVDYVRASLPRSPGRRLLLLLGLVACIGWYTLGASSSSSSDGSGSTLRSPLGVQLARPGDRVPHPAHPAADAPNALIHRRLVAVADLHGDYEHALNVLEMANLIDARPSALLPDGTPRWVGGHDVLVSTGDIVDRGPDTIKLYRLFASLRAQAAAQDPPGRVVNLLGNHEIMNALRDWRYVTSPDLDSFGGAEARRKAMSADGWIGKEWLQHYNVTASVDLLPADFLPEEYAIPRASFVHGGITPEYASAGDRTRKDGGIERINALGHSFLRKALSNPKPDGRLPPDTTHDEAELYGADGPLWYRGYALDDDDAAVCVRAEKAAHALGVDFLVMGHTPHFDGFVVRCPQARILLIDTGISRAYGGEQSALVFDTELRRAPTPDIEQQIGAGPLAPPGVPPLGPGPGLGSAGGNGGQMMKTATTIKVGQPVVEEVSQMEHAKGMHRWVERRTITALYWRRVPTILHMGERDVWL